MNHDKVVSVNNVLRQYNEIKEDIESSKNVLEYTK